MRRKTRTWLWCGLLLLLAAVFWSLTIRRKVSEATVPAGDQRTDAAPATGQTNPTPLVSTVSRLTPAPATNESRVAAVPALTNRLSNTTKSIAELMRSDQALLLRNALIDTSARTDLAIPPHLRGAGDPGSYVVQSRKPLDDDFRALLKAAGAGVVSYIPNNAYLVRVAAAGADQLRAASQTQGVLPWEPYYKLDLNLLELAVKEQPLPDDAQLAVLLFSGEREAGLQSLKASGAEILGEDRSPFGHVLIIRPAPDSLVALAKNPMVQSLEVHRARQPANDLGRRRTGVVTNTSAATANYLDLTGANILVNVNDTGGDDSHPDLTGRILGPANTDPDGHGTHVIGTIISTGASSPPGTNASGSASNATFRGVAPSAKVYVQSIDLITGPQISDAWLQENAARTNAFISNNSWGYVQLFDYNLSAASFDAAVRDSLPDETGSRPMVYVFAAGNSGAGSTTGQGGIPDTVLTPGSAKNVITVGAIENLRRITNSAVDALGVTNQPFLGSTDSDRQVASFSSRGNVGVGQEGPNGRFKPDVVAPGTFVVSTRASEWKDPTSSGGVLVNRITDQQVLAGSSNLYSIFAPSTADRLVIRTVPNTRSPNPFPTLPIYASMTSPPAVPADQVGSGSASFNISPGTWYYSIGNPGSSSVDFDIQTILFVTNSDGTRLVELKKLNDKLAPFYRYESGTSMAAPMASGMLALMQEFFEQRLGRTNSPALMKALLINGARSADTQYSLQVQNQINYQGWGLINLTNSLPRAMAGAGGPAAWPIAVFDQDPDNALATGQSHTRTLTMKSVLAQQTPLRVTLVWTDPPGNPAASLKLVNDLDLVVSNNVAGGEVYVGNNFPQGSDFTSATDPADLALVPNDVVNNVENVYINSPLAKSYTVTVRARRVNVNAVTSQTNGVLQDYALVISSENSTFTNIFTVAPGFIPGNNPTPFVKGLSNGVPLIHERVGANNPLLSSNVPNAGVTNQWNFYVYTNTTAFTNVAFVTFLPPNMSRPRFRDADIDLYVSRDGALTNLDATALAGSLKSLSRTGTELVIVTNVPSRTVLYVGVKSEDQEAAEFGIFAFASNSLGQRDANGNIPLVFFPVEIPDGSPEAPQAGVTLAIAADSAPIRRLILTNIVTHENGGDLLGVLSHNQKFVVLNNHRSWIGTSVSIYDDSGENDIPFSQHTDGPGSLRNYAGDPAFGVWQLSEIDSAPNHVGRIDAASGYIEPERQQNGSGTLVLTVAGHQWRYRTCDVPIGVTNLIAWLRQKNPLLPLDLYVRRGNFPDIVTYDKKARINPPGGEVSVGLGDSPPIRPGRYYIGVSNPNIASVTFTQGCDLQFQLQPVEVTTFASTNTPMLLIDDAVTNSVISVTNNRTIADVKVGLRLSHPRVSDLVLHLVSPQGTRIMLAENRGGPNATNYGSGILITNVYPQSSSGGAAEQRSDIDTGQSEGLIKIDYNFYQVPDSLRIYYEGNRIFDSGLINGSGTFSVPYGPGTSNTVTIVMNEGNNSQVGTLWNYTATVLSGNFSYAMFTDNENLGRPIKFATPPYAITPTNLVLYSDGFEAATATNYVQGDIISNSWLVLTNYLAVLTDTNHAHTGTNLLALSNGQLGVPLPTVADHDYRLSFAYRKVSSAPTQTVSVSVSTLANIYKGLDVSNAPANPLMSVAAVAVPKVRLCPGQEIVITASSNCFNLGGATCTGPEGVTNSLFQGLPNYSLVGCWSRSPKTLDSNTVASAPFYIGTNTLFLAPGSPGDYYLFLGMNDDNFQGNAAGAFDVVAEWQQCQWSGAEYVLGTTTNSLDGDFSWKTTSLLFTANPTTTNLILQPDINYTMEFDSFQLIEPIHNAYFLSEEPLAPLLGQSALGDWTLEIWDNRSGPGTAPATLLSWSLNFVYADAPACLPLTNGIPYVGEVRGDEIKCFIVEVPREIGLAQNFLADLTMNSGVQLLYSSTGVPTGNSPPDPVGPQPSGVVFPLDPTFPPGAELQLGGRYYLGVQNINPSETNSFSLQVDFDISITPLSDGVPVLATIPLNRYRIEASTDSIIAVTNMQYYSFDVATDANSATFSVDKLDGDVNLVLRRALPVVDLFPRPIFYDYESTTCYTNTELIILNTNSLPVKLAAGRWYLGVYNVDTNAVKYRITAQQATNLLYTTFDLTNSVATNFTVAPYTVLTNFYRFVVDQTNAGVLFELCAVTGDADLIVKRADLPSRELYDFSNVRVGANPEAIELRTNLFIPDVNATNWFIAVVNYESFAVDVTLRASLLTTNAVTNCTQTSGIVPITVTSGACYTNTVGTNEVDYYRFRVDPNVYRVDFMTTNANGNVDLYLLTNGVLPSPWPTTFERSSTNPLNADELIPVVTNGTMQLPPGDWYLAVVNQDVTNVTYTFCAIEYFNPPPATPLAGCATLTNVVAGFQTNYYSFDVSSNAVEADFEILNPGGNVDLFVVQGLPATNILSSSVDPGSANEFVAVTTNSAPVPLSPGTWYFMVVNHEATNVTYAVRVSEIHAPQIVPLSSGVPHDSTLAVADGCVGEDYFVFTVSTDAIQATFETLQTDGNVDLFLRKGLPLPRAASFDSASQNTGTALEDITLITNQPPALTPGDWYLTVLNRDAVPVNYRVQATEILGSSIIQLTNGVPISNTVSAATSPSAPGLAAAGLGAAGLGAGTAGLGVDYYRYIVSNNAVQVNFETLCQDGNVDLFLRKGLPTPGPTRFDYASTNSSSTYEFIAVTTNSVPVPLSAGEWYLAVVNRETNVVNYCLRIAEIDSPNIVRLQDNIAYPSTVRVVDGPSGVTGVDYYVFNVPTNAAEAFFETFNATGNVDLYLHKGLPLPDPAITGSIGNPTSSGDEMIVLATNSAPIALAPGDWYLAVFNRDTIDVSYSVRVSTSPKLVIRLHDGIAYTNSLARRNLPSETGVDYYVFTVSPDATQVNFETFLSNGNVDLYVRKGLPLPGTTLFDFRSATPVTGDEFVLVDGSTFPTLSPGDWYLAVVNVSVATVNYRVRATEISPSEIIDLTNGVPYSNTVLGSHGSKFSGIQYYRFHVSDDAMQATFKTFGANGNVNIYMQYGLPLPDATSQPRGIRGGTNNEVIRLTASSPVPLAPGDWYIAVINQDPVDVGYSICASEITTGPGGLVVLNNGIPYNATVSPSPDCLPDQSIDYYLYTASTDAVRVQFEVRRPSEDVRLILRYLLPLPDLPNFFFWSSDLPGTKNEYISVIKNDQPGLLLPGDWYLGVVHGNSNSVSYQVVASEYTVAGTNIQITSYREVNDSLCLTWTNSLPGLDYVVQGALELRNLPPLTRWMAASPTITASNYQTTYCIPLPTPFRFFRIAEGSGLDGATPPDTITSITATNGGYQLLWHAPPNGQFGVAWSPKIPATYWNTIPGLITSFTTNYFFLDDGSQTGGLRSPRFYRVIHFP